MMKFGASSRRISTKATCVLAAEWEVVKEKACMVVEAREWAAAVAHEWEATAACKREETAAHKWEEARAQVEVRAREVAVRVTQMPAHESGAASETGGQSSKGGDSLSGESGMQEDVEEDVMSVDDPAVMPLESGSTVMRKQRAQVAKVREQQRVERV